MRWAITILIGVSFMFAWRAHADSVIVKLRGDLDLSSFKGDRTERKKLVAALKLFHAGRARAIRGHLHELSIPESDITSFWILNALRVTAKPDVLAKIQALNSVESIEPDLPREVAEIPLGGFTEWRRDDLPPIGWGLEKIGAPELWAQGVDGKGVVVAMLDSGVNFDHQDLIPVLWKNPGEIENGKDDDGNGYIDDVHGYNFEQKNGNPTDDFAHGSKTAGIVAGTGAKGTKTGVAPGARLMILKTCCSTFSNEIFESNNWEAIQYAMEQGADVVSMSLTSKHTSSPAYDKWRRIGEIELAGGLVHVNSVGNGGSGKTPYNIGAPANNPPAWFHPDQVVPSGLSLTSMISVGATNPSDEPRSFSSSGPVTWESVSQYGDYAYTAGQKPGLKKPDICAPSDVPSTDLFGSEYAIVFSGTSSSAPHVAGVVALLLSRQPRLTVAQITEAIQMTAAPVEKGFTNHCGAGRLDAVAAFLYANSKFSH